MPETQYHQVLCSLTEEEYNNLHADQAEETRDHPPLLYNSTQGDADSYFEDDITLIVRDCLIEICSDDAQGEALAEIERDSFDATTLPFGVKVAVMSAAKENWSPPRQTGNHYDGSEWTGGPEEAQKLADAHPDLMNMLLQPTKVA